MAGVGPLTRRAGWLGLGTAVGLAVAAAAGAFDEEHGPAGGATTSLRAARDKFLDARTSARNQSLAHLVETRLRHEKTIEAGRIEVTVEGETTVVLEGNVVDHDDKEEAMDPARNTRGVLKFVDHLAVRPVAMAVIDASGVRDHPGDVAARDRVVR